MKTYANLIDPKVLMVNVKGVDFEVETTHSTSLANIVEEKKLVAGVAPEAAHISQRAREIYEAMSLDGLQDLCDGEATLPPEIVRALDSDDTTQL
ncbi:hypothetical protein Trisim1_006657 [Trichoderma cf. simile WF8]